MAMSQFLRGSNCPGCVTSVAGCFRGQVLSLTAGTSVRSAGVLDGKALMPAHI
jgi:hypothetical protein